MSVDVSGIERAPQQTLSDAALRVAWDARAVATPGGDMHQGSAFAADRLRRGIGVIALTVDDQPLLVTLRKLPLLGLGIATVSRGPAVPSAAGLADLLRIPEQLRRVAHWLRREEGVVELRADPWAPASEALAAAWRTAGFTGCEEAFFSRHTMWIHETARPGLTEEQLFSSVSATKRNEVSAARRAGVTVRRIAPHDETALHEVATIINETAERRAFAPLSIERTMQTWRDLIAARQMEVWLATLADGRLAAVETAIRHGERLTSHHAGARALDGGAPLGVVPLLRWTLINQARSEGRIADLGGADIAGHRQVPSPGDRMYGLYSFKRAFGAEWVQMTGAHSILVDGRGARLRAALRRLPRVRR